MTMPLALVWDLVAVNKASPAFDAVAASALRTSSATDKASVATTRAGTAMSRASRGFATLTGVSAKLGFALGGVAAIVESFKVGQQFQKQMLQIQTMTGGTAAEVRNMSKALLDMSGQVATGPTELATSLYHVESVGLRGAKALGVVRVAAQGAKVGMADLEETTNALTSTVASGIPGVKNMQQAMGALVTIVGAGDMKLSDLNAALGGGILSVVKGYGLSLNDVGAALATFGDNNIRGADAATALRMAVQSLAVPAARGADAIDSIGLKMNTLQQDMQEGGLNKALLDLNKHMKDAGITAVQAGAFLTEAFGKRAGIGLAVLINQIDRFEQKSRLVAKGSENFASKWEQTTHTVGFAFEKVGAELQALGVRAFEAAGPALTKFADFLSTTLPHAIHSTYVTLKPLIDTVRGAFVTAWHVAAAVIPAVAHALGDVLGFLARNGVILRFAEAVTAMWAAFKGYEIAVLAFRLIRASALLARDGILNMAAAGGVGVAAVAAITAAFGALGFAISHWLESGKIAIAMLNNLKDAEDSWKNSILAADGALNSSVKTTIAATLQAGGLADKAAQAGISLVELTNAVTGNDSQMKSLIAKWAASGKLTGDLRVSLLAAAATYRKASTDGKALAAVQDQGKHSADGQTTSVHSLALGMQGLTQFQKTLAVAEKETQVTLNGVTYAMKGQSSAADVLNAALARLSGDQNAVAESQLALKDSLAGLTDQVKQNGHSLDQNTAKGRSNLEWLHQQIDSINAVASAQIKNHASTQKVVGTLRENEAALRRVAVANHLNGDEVDRLIKKYAATPKKIETYMDANSDPATTKALALKQKLDDLVKQRIAIIKAGSDPLALLHVQNQIDELTRPRTLPVTPVLTGSLPTIQVPGGPVRAQAAGTSNIPQGYSTVGERGWELIKRTGNQVSVFSNPASRAMTGWPSRLPGFADGTSGTKLSAADIAHDTRTIASILRRFDRIVQKTGADLKSAFSPVMDAFRQFGASREQLHKLATLDNKLARAVDRRNKDLDRLHSLVQARRQESGAIAGTVRGAFDIATAGGGPSGQGTPRFGTIYAQALQQKNLVRKWAAGIRKLGRVFSKSPVGRAMLRRLAEDGPDSWPQVSALISANPKQLQNLIATERQISSTARSVGGYVSGTLFNDRIAGARSDVARDRHAVTHELRLLRHDVQHLADALHITLKVNDKVLATATATGGNKNARRT